MKKLSILISTIIVAGMLVFVSCTKTGPQGPSGANGATGPIIYGTISGNVIMANQYGVAVTNDYTGGYILLKNSTTNATIDSVIANSSGQYAIGNVPTGTYNMECIYAGYGMNLHQNVEVNGNLQLDNKIAAIPNFNVNYSASTPVTPIDSIGLVKEGH